VIVDRDMQSFPARMFVLTTAAAVPAPNDLLEAGQALDVEMQQISREGMLIAHYGRRGMQIAPAAEPRPAQDAAHVAGLSPVVRAM